MTKPKAVMIVGQTSSGKSALAVALAERLNGEVISADSRQVYRELNLSVGKTTLAEQAGIPHHLLDIVGLDTVYTGADFVRDASLALAQITEASKLPIVAGGTFFYTELLQGKKTFAPVSPNLALRAELERAETTTLFERLRQVDPRRASTIDRFNRPRLIRAVEIAKTKENHPTTAKNPSSFPDYDWLTLGIKIEPELLHQRIEARLKTRLQAGLVEEVKTLLDNGIPPTRLYSLGLEIRYTTQYLLGEISYDDLLPILLTKNRQFAKRQQTWLKKDQSIVWLDFPVDLERAEKLVRDFFAS